MPARMASRRLAPSLRSFTFGLLVLLTGCGQEKAPGPSREVASPQVAEKPPAETTPNKDEPRPVAPVEDRLHQPFHKATRPPENALPPQLTITDKSVGKIYAEVERLWPAIRFVTPDGRKLQYQARLDTNLGTIEIELWPEVAPNHVRNFVALARAGYYDGLFFESCIGTPDETAKNALRAVTAGSPEGDGNELSSIGYWLLPEIADTAAVRHRPGTVGACRGPDLDTASCRFYITLTEAPLFDGNFTVFGRVTRGLDVVEKIFMQMHQAEADGFLPPTIQQVRISVQPLEMAGSGANNN